MSLRQLNSKVIDHSCTLSFFLTNSDADRIRSKPSVEPRTEFQSNVYDLPFKTFRMYKKLIICRKTCKRMNTQYLHAPILWGWALSKLSKNVNKQFKDIFQYNHSVFVGKITYNDTLHKSPYLKQINL